MGAVAAGAGIIGGIVQTIQGAKETKQARKAIDEYERQELTNAYEGTKISTAGSDLQEDILRQSTATTMGALKSGGARALLGGIGKVQQANVKAAQDIGVSLDEKQERLDMLKAGEEIRIEQTKERREEQDLAGLGQQLQSGRQTTMSGLSNIVGAAGAGAQMQMINKGMPAGQSNPFVTPVQTSPQGIVGGAVGFNAPIYTG